ncbi:malonyl-ACP O-methyltransferase BioC [Haliovirga abyssi]|uniref:Malonyl-[acyl-carrier protein] O-methyltransferase n=1 Tax=Haliovirga abyssi TaxID=2996794 RepID=A0AAU9DD75_9FUSO|nr:malonyl-ACP O-methyltransferase BioC [Haliovirga abyssi]BDU50267.1 malonyl-[acyl-carrier protein] O-methyltransferase [Haliovirga abyssi]
MIEKEKVIKNFSKGAKTYDKYAKVQKYMAEKLNKLFIEHKEKNINCDMNSKKQILEIGNGTGILTEYILKKYKNLNMDLIDISPEMIKISKEKFKNINNNLNYIVGDAEEYDFNKKYDLIISNATFQWFKDFENTINKLYDSLNNGGEIIFSTFGKETYNELRKILKSISEKYDYSQTFYSMNDIEKIIRDIGAEFTLIEENYIEKFKNVREFLFAIKKIGANSAKEKKEILTPGVYKQLEKEYKKNFTKNNKIIVTNHIIFCKIKKEIKKNIV